MIARRMTLAACCAALSLTLSACAGKGGADAKRPETAQERQDRAMKDPFGYKPDWSDTSVGGRGSGSRGVADLDKDGLKKDLGHVIMP